MERREDDADTTEGRSKTDDGRKNIIGERWLRKRAGGRKEGSISGGRERERDTHTGQTSSNDPEVIIVVLKETEQQELIAHLLLFFLPRSYFGGCASKEAAQEEEPNGPPENRRTRSL